MESQIIGTIRGTSNELITGKLLINLDAPLVDITTTPDTVRYPKIQSYTITNGNLNAALINLQRSDEVTYFCRFLYTVADQIFYLDGLEYARVDYLGNKTGGFWNLRAADSQYYTGEVYNAATSKLLARVLRNYDLDLFEPFHFRIPENAPAQVEWSTLQHSNINTSNIDTSAYFIAQIINAQFGQAIASQLFNFRGAWNNTTVYQKNDAVRYDSDNNIYFYFNATPSAGTLPTNTTNWALFLEGGEISTTIDPSQVLLDTAFSSAWDGVTNKGVTADKLYDQLIGYARLADATFTNLKAPTRANSTSNTDVATTAFVQSVLSAYTPPLPTTAPNIPLSNRGNQIVNANTLKLQLNRACMVHLERPSGTSGGVGGGTVHRQLTTIKVNSNNCAVGLTSGFIQIPPGFYEVSAGSAVCGVDKHRIILRTSTGVDLVLGESRETDNRGYQLQYRGNDWAYAHGFIETFTTINVGIYHLMETAGGSEDLGKPSNRGGPEVYAWIKLICLDVY